MEVGNMMSSYAGSDDWSSQSVPSTWIVGGFPGSLILLPEKLKREKPELNL